MKIYISWIMTLSLLLTSCTALNDTASNTKLNSLDKPNETTQEYPLFLTTMTHMEGPWKDDKNEGAFLKHVEQLHYGMDLAEEYDAILTVETEKPFARANTVWDLNIMKEVLDRGHGVGTHCDLGGKKEKNISIEELSRQMKENKELVDALVGAENNHGCSGAGSYADWAQAGLDAGFDYINGIVGMHLFAVPQEKRPDPSWDDEYLTEVAYHYNFPEDVMERIYLMQITDTQDFEADGEGIVVSNGELGRVDGMVEEGHEASEEDCPDGNCPFTTKDVDILVETILDVSDQRDRSQVAKLNVYFPALNFVPENEPVLRYFFSEMQKLEDEGHIQWSTQWNVVKTYLESQEFNNEEETDSIPEDSESEKQRSEEGIYTLFSLNVHDFVFPEQSIEAVNRVIDIHEQYDVPVDIYLNDQVFQVYMDETPDLVERLKNSPVVTVGYHLRAPTPYYFDYADFDYKGLNELSEEELYETLLDYEEHKLNLETGDPTDEPGGYQFIEDTIGYAPPVVSTMVSSQYVQKSLTKIYVEKGAKYTVIHGRDIDLGTRQGDLLVRPEHVDYKLYEKFRSGMDGAAVFEDAISQIPEEGLRFIGMKYHESNFYIGEPPFWPIFYTDPDKGGLLEPPFNLDAPYSVVKQRKEADQEKHWTLYKSTVKYAGEHQNEVHPIGVLDLETLL